MSQPSFHENLSPADEPIIGSEKSFGIVFAVVFLVISLFPLVNGDGIRVWALIGAGLFLALAFFAPKTLTPLNRIWFKFGLLIHKIMTPIIMGVIFFGTVLPTGLLMRLFGKKPLDLNFEKNKQSYWIHRTSPSPEPGSMKRQF